MRFKGSGNFDRAGRRSKPVRFINRKFMKNSNKKCKSCKRRRVLYHHNYCEKCRGELEKYYNEN